MIGFVGVRRNSIGQIAKAVTVAQLPENIFSGVHRMTDLLLNCKGSQFKSSPSIFRSKDLYLNNLQTSPKTFSGH
jgi:hypothetical protein